MIYYTVKKLGINELTICARYFILSIILGECNSLLSILYNYSIETYNHSQNVATLAIIVGLKSNLSLSEFKSLAIGAFLHDIGKIMIPHKIIAKNGFLSEKEREIINKHPEFGYDIVKPLEYIPDKAKLGIYEHHENYDGSGYPNKLYGMNIHKISRIIHICDVYEALCSKRSYKDAMSRVVSRNIIEESSGTMFDPFLVKQFKENIPTYLTGEEIIKNGKVAVVSDSSNKLNPIVNIEGFTSTVNDIIT